MSRFDQPRNEVRPDMAGAPDDGNAHVSSYAAVGCLTSSEPAPQGRLSVPVIHETETKKSTFRGGTCDGW